MSHHLFGSCKNCGEAMEGDGYSVVLHCPDTETDYSCLEPDANPVYCNYAEDNDDLTMWKRRALLAESRVREQDKIIDRMGEDLNALNGPTFMGEPVLPKRQPDSAQLVEAASFPPYQRCTALEYVPVAYSSNTSQPSPAPDVQGEPIGWYTEDHLDDKSATTYNAEVAQRWRDKGWPVWPLYAAPRLVQGEGGPEGR